MSKIFDEDDNIAYKLPLVNDYLSKSIDDRLNDIFNFIDNYPESINDIKYLIQLNENDITNDDRFTYKIAISLLQKNILKFPYTNYYDAYCFHNRVYRSLDGILNKFSGNSAIIILLLKHFNKPNNHEDTSTMISNIIDTILYACKFNEDIYDYLELINYNLNQFNNGPIYYICRNYQKYTPDELINNIEYLLSKGYTINYSEYDKNILYQYLFEFSGGNGWTIKNKSIKTVEYLHKTFSCNINFEYLQKYVKKRYICLSSDIVEYIYNNIDGEYDNEMIWDLVSVDHGEYLDIVSIIKCSNIDINYVNKFGLNLLEHYANLDTHGWTPHKNMSYIPNFEKLIKYLIGQGLKIKDKKLAKKVYKYVGLPYIEKANKNNSYITNKNNAYINNKNNSYKDALMKGL